MTARVPCPCCPRLVLPDMLRDISGVPDVFRGSAEMACDQCCARWHYTGALRYGEQARFRGMPAPVVAAVAAKHGDATPPQRAALVAKLATRLGGRLLPGADRQARAALLAERVAEIRAARVRGERPVLRRPR